MAKREQEHVMYCQISR